MPIINVNRPQVHMCPLYLEPPSHLPAHPIPPGCQRALALGALTGTSHLHWLSVLHMVTWMFQWRSLKSCYPLLPLSPKVCPLLLCLCNDTRFGFVSGSEYKTRKWKGFFLSLSVNMEGLWLSVRYRIRNVSVGKTPSWSLDSNPPPSTQNPWRMLLQSLLQSLLWQTTQWHQTTNEHSQG